MTEKITGHDVPGLDLELGERVTDELITENNLGEIEAIEQLKKGEA